MLLSGISSLSLTPSANPLAVGGNVSLTPKPLMNITAGTWLLNGSVLVLFYPDHFFVSDSHKGRMFFNLSTSQICLYSVQVTDSGLYELQGISPNVKADLHLSVQGKLSYTNKQKYFTTDFYILH